MSSRASLQAREVHLSIDDQRQQAGIEHGDAGRFGGREPAEDLAADDDGGCQQGRDGDEDPLQHLRDPGARVGGIAARLRVGVDGGHLDEADQQARDDAGKEEAADRDREHAAPDDHQDRGRDDDGKDGRDRRDRHREAVVVALPALRLDEDLGLAGRVGGGGAGDAGEEDREHHVDLGEAAREVADQCPGEAHQAVGDAAHVHQVGGEQEQRHGQEDERVEGVEGLADHVHGREVRLDQHDRQAGEAQREGDRDPQRHQAEEDPEEDPGRGSGRESVGTHGTCLPRVATEHAQVVRHALAHEQDPGDRRRAARPCGSATAAARPAPRSGRWQSA